MPARGVQRRRAGVRRRVVTATTVVVVMLLAGVFAFADQLRHPSSGDGRLAGPEVTGDPRDELDCPDFGDPDEPEGELVPGVVAVEVSSTDLLNCPDAYDGRLVRYTGEAVGELLRRRTHAWVQLNDDVYSTPGGTLPQRDDYAGANSGIGARLPRDAAEEITTVGGPHRHGDTVTVEGRFHRSMPATADAMAIEAEQVERVATGEPVRDPLLSDRRLVALALAVLAAVMVAGERMVARRR